MAGEASPADALRAGWARADRIAGAALFALAVLVVFESRTLPIGSLGQPGPGFWPIVTAAGLGLGGLAVAARGRASVVMRATHWADAPRVLGILAGCAFAAFALERLGYRLTIFILLLAFLGVLERQRLWVTLGVAAAVSVGSFWLFADLLRVLLPRGPWGL
jgi:hypothetical protein